MMLLSAKAIGTVKTALRCAALAAGLAGLAHAAAAQTLPPEVQVGSRAIIDFEFDWARDGVNCPTCNYADGNSRLTYIDTAHNLWLGYVDFLTGDFSPTNGQALLLDTNVTTPQEIGNGPEWMASQRGSEIVYTRWTNNQPRTPPWLKLGFAHMSDGAWIAGEVANSASRVLPVGTIDLNDAVPAANYQAYVPDGMLQSLFWRNVSSGALDNPIPISSTDPGMTRRWVPGTRDIIITAPAPPDALGGVWRQVFLYHTMTNTLEQLTYGATSKSWAFMWQAPEYNNEQVFFVVVNGNHLNIYRNFPYPNGTARWTVVDSAIMPAATPNIVSPEPFVHNGHSWIFFTLSADRNGRDYTATSLIAMAGIVPDSARSSIRFLTSADNPPRARRDPEYFITANGPYIYYNRYYTTGTQISEGIFRVDTGLGPAIP